MRGYVEQLGYLWGQLGLSQRVSLLFSGGAILAVVVGLLVWSSQPKLQLLYGRLDSNSLAEVVSKLEGSGVEYRVDGSSVFVPADRVYTLRMELASNGVVSGSGVGFEIFDETKFGISDFVQKTNYIRAIQGELSRTVSQLQGVRSARVMVSMPENRLLAEQANIRPTASVFVDLGGANLGEGAVNSVRYLVANSVEGLHVDDVAVVDNHGNVLSESLKGDGVMGVVSGGMRFRQGMEEYYTRKIEGMLVPIVGVNNVVARVSVKVNTDTATMVEEIYDPNGQVVRSQTVTEDKSLKDDSSPTQVAGNVQVEGDMNAVSAQVSTSKDSTKKKVISYEISRSTVETVKGPGKIEEISAAVFLALKEEGEGADMKSSPRSMEEMEVIKKMIANVIGVALNEVDEYITIQEVPFAKREPMQTASFIGIPESVYEILDILKGFGSLGLALLMFMIFFRMVKKHEPEPGVVELLEGGGVGAGARDVTPKPTAELINELIKQKPENIGSTLKDWVNDESNK